MDSAPAESYVQRGSVKLVAEGLNKLTAPGIADYVLEALGPGGSSATHRYLNVLGA